MKSVRSAIPILFLLLISYPASCQWDIGIKGGGNYSSMRTVKYGGADAKLSFHGGVTVNRLITEKSILSADLIFSQKGFSQRGNGVHLNYIELPAVFSYLVNKKIAVGGGIYTAYLISSREVKSGSDDTNPIWGSKIDLGPCVQFSYFINPSMGLALRYEHGLLNVITKDAKAPHYRALQPDDPPLNYNDNLRDMRIKHTNTNVQLSFFKMFGKGSN